MTTSLGSRLLFPEDRTSFVYQGAFEPILTPPVTAVQIFTDEAATQVADLLDVNQNPIANSTVYTDTSGLIPEFYGPSGSLSRLWAKVVGATVDAYPLDAQFSSQIALVPTLITGTGPPTEDIGVIGSMYLDIAAYVIYGPRTMSGWPPDGHNLQGPTGGVYEYQQTSPLTPWTIPNPLTYRPNVMIIDSAGTEVLGDVSFSGSNIIVAFSVPVSGTALLS